VKVAGIITTNNITVRKRKSARKGSFVVLSQKKWKSPHPAAVKVKREKILLTGDLGLFKKAKIAKAERAKKLNSPEAA
jgi:hypothetical protein